MVDNNENENENLNSNLNSNLNLNSNFSDDDINYNDFNHYQKTFLKVFDIKEYNDEIIAEKLDYYNNYEENEDLREIKKHLAEKLSSEDLKLGLMSLFSYDYLGKFIIAMKNNDFKPLYYYLTNDENNSVENNCIPNQNDNDDEKVVIS